MMELREFKVADLRECAELFFNVFTVEPWNDQWKSIDSAREYLTEFIENPSFKGFIAISNGNIIGVCFGHIRSYWQGKEFQIDEMYVANDFQGQGVGTKLMGFVKESLTQQGIKNMLLLTGKDFPAEKFYIKNGFYRNEYIVVMNYRAQCIIP